MTYNIRVEWYQYFGMIGFLTLAFIVFLAIAFNSIQKSQNHYRYHRMKPGMRTHEFLKKTRPTPFKILIPVAFLLAWSVVHFFVFD